MGLMGTEFKLPSSSQPLTARVGAARLSPYRWANPAPGNPVHRVGCRAATLPLARSAPCRGRRRCQRLEPSIPPPYATRADRRPALAPPRVGRAATHIHSAHKTAGQWQNLATPLTHLYIHSERAGGTEGDRQPVTAVAEVELPAPVAQRRLAVRVAAKLQRIGAALQALGQQPSQQATAEQVLLAACQLTD